MDKKFGSLLLLVFGILLLVAACSARVDAVIPTPAATLLPTAAPTPTLAPTPTTTREDKDPVLALSSLVAITTPRGSGSGIIIEGQENGNHYVLTNAHLVWPGHGIRVFFSDKTEENNIEVVGLDLVADLAVLGPIKEVRPAVIGDWEDLVVGDTLFLVEHGAVTKRPTVVSHTLSGVVEWTPIGVRYLATVQPIHERGGAVVSRQGKVVGMSGFSAGADFGLVMAMQDALERAQEMIAGKDVSGLGNRQIPLEGGQTHHAVTLESSGVHAYVFNEPAGTEVEISVQSENNMLFLVSDFNGRVLLGPVDETLVGVETGSTKVEVAGPHFLLIRQQSEDPGEFEVTSNVTLAPYNDPDDGKVLSVGETVVGLIDPLDVDDFVLELEEGEEVAICVDSLNIDPVVIVSFDGSTQEQIRRDEDSGGGIFGENAFLHYKAPHRGFFRVVVRDESLKSHGGYFLSIRASAKECSFHKTSGSGQRFFIRFKRG